MIIFMDDNWKEVLFDKYCPLCKYEKVNEGDDPCNDCLAQGALLDTHKPLYFEKKEQQ